MASFYPINAPLVNYFFYNYTLTTDGPNLPLAGGFIFFRDNDDHDVEKNTYSDVSDPNNPVVNPNPIQFNAVGALPLFYAEEGSYYIIITGPDGDLDNPIWTFENVNFGGEPGSSSENIVNYAPNGQFLLHNDLPETPDKQAGEVREDSTPVAYGNWTFERSPGSNSTDFVTFEQYAEWSANPTGNPVYSIRIQCTEADSNDNIKALRITFPDVNRFASAGQFYTFAFSGIDNDALDFPVDLYLVKNFGTDGSDQEAVLLETFTLTADESDFYHSFTFGTNQDKVIGAGSFVALDVRMRTDETFDISMTDFQLQSGNLAQPPYPETTQQQDVSAALGGGFPIPNPDGSDLFLVPRLTRTGWIYDDAEIGASFTDFALIDFDGATGLHAASNLMLAAGYKYITAEYSPLGIPFRRLFNKIFDDTVGVNVPLYGTGADYLTCAYAGTGSQLIISNNTLGSVSNAANGSPSTTFTIATIHQGDTGYFCKAYMVAADTFYIQNTSAGVVTDINANNSGFTVAVVQAGNTVVPEISSVQTIAASGITAADYFTFYTYNVTPQQYYLWMTIDGAGADPAPGGAGIKVDLLSTDDAATVAQKIRTSLNGFEVTTIQTVAASSVPAGSFFTISATGGGYYIWYTIGGTGTQPSPGGTGIKVELISTDDAATVASKTQKAINSYSFAIPDVRGQFLRAANSGATVDPGVRWSMVPGVIGNQTLGTYELSDNLSHVHIIRNGTGAQSGTGADVFEPNGPVGDNTTEYSGITESRPLSMNVTCAIRY
jgi:hypothetical protein